MRLALSLFLAFAIMATAQAQDILMYKTFGGVRFERDSLVISPRQVQSILWENAIASEKFRKARLNSSVSAVLGFAGGVLIGIPVGTAIIGGGDPEWGFALGGAALIGVSIPFNRAFKRNAQDALDIHNQKKGARRNFDPEFYWSGTQLGLRLKI
jgi:hypothetical protein